MARVVCSGYFDPLTIGHIEYLRGGKRLAGSEGKLIVIVNNDKQAMLKKGRAFMPEAERLDIVSELRCVDEVVLSTDEDRTVRRSLAALSPRADVFANGGDQTNTSIPEGVVCEELGIRMMDGLGPKIQSSSWLVQAAIDFRASQRFGAPRERPSVDEVPNLQ